MTYYHITTEQLQGIEDNLGHDNFAPIQWEGNWIVSVPDWYGDVPSNWQYLDMTAFEEYKSTVE